MNELGSTSLPACPFCGSMATRQQAGHHRSWVCGSHGVPSGHNREQGITRWRDLEQSSTCHVQQWGELNMIGPIEISLRYEGVVRDPTCEGD